MSPVGWSAFCCKKQWVLRAAWAVSLSLGLSASNPCISYMPEDSSQGKSWSSFLGGKWGSTLCKERSRRATAFSPKASSKWAWEGVPTNSKISKSSYVSVEQYWKKGQSYKSSMNRQPILHISGLSPQSVSFKSIQGARQQKVQTGPVITSCQKEEARARPKSAILRLPETSMRILSGLRSRWIMPMEWRQAIPSRSCFIIFLTSQGAKRCLFLRRLLMQEARERGQYSIIMYSRSPPLKIQSRADTTHG